MCDLGKFHKGDFTQPPHRPVALVVVLPLHRINWWVDNHLKVLLPYCRTCAKNSENVLRRMKKFKRVHSKHHITACDAEKCVLTLR